MSVISQETANQETANQETRPPTLANLGQETQHEPDHEPDIVFPRSDLYSNEPPLETELHLRQMILLITCLEWLWRDRNDFYASGNLTVYYSPNQRKTEHFRGPDFFVVLGTERKPRKSWVVWEEDGKYPNLIIELLSESTATTDRGLKKQIYQDIFRTPEYFWFDPNTLELQGYELMRGQYQTMQPDPRGWLWSHQLQLFLGIQDGKLRFFTADGQLVPTPEEAAQAAQKRNEKLAAKLRELGVDPETL